MLLAPEGRRDEVYGPEQLDALAALVDLTDCCDRCGELESISGELAEVEIICSTWGIMKLDDAFLAAAAKLKAVFYGAGSVRGFTTPAFWERNILLTNASHAIGVGVAESSVAMLVLGLKKAWESARLTKENRAFTPAKSVHGLYKARIGVIGAGMVGRHTLKLLDAYQVEKCVSDPNLSDEDACALGATRMGMEEIFRTCHAVTLHAPNLPSTEHMIRGRHFGSMQDGALFVNTARGLIVKEDEMIEELKKGRIFACLDVTDPEPAQSDSPLYDLPNVFLTPHTAGTVGLGRRRIGDEVVEEVRRYCAGEPAAFPVSREMLEWMA